MNDLTLLYIGRFAPFHNGHKSVIDHALSLNPKRLIVVVGSAGQPRSFKTPFTAQERGDMVRNCYPDNDKIVIIEAPDFPYSYKKWESQILFAVAGAEPDFTKLRLLTSKPESYFKGALMGMPHVAAPVYHPSLAATQIRAEYFGDNDSPLMRANCPVQTQGFLDFWPEEFYNDMKFEHELVTEYQKKNSLNQYPAAILCADAVVVQNEKVLMIKRGPKSIGRGLWALPGGHVNPREMPLDAAVRELLEETSLAVDPDEMIFGEMFASPDRDARGRCITQAFLFDLPADEFYHIKAGDDAADVAWFPIATLDPNLIYADHYHIIRDMTL